MNLTVQMNGLPSFLDKVKGVQRAAQSGMKRGVDEAAGMFQQTSRNNSPVLTGANRDSITVQVVEDSPTRQVRSIAPHMPYSARLEYGFVGADSLGRVYHQQPQPYMRPAFDENKDEAIDIINGRIIEAVGKKL